MRIANRPVLSRTAQALVLSAAASLALLLMLVTGSDSIVQAQTPDTPTPETTQGPGDWDGVENLPPIEGERNPPTYPNMDSNLNRIVEQVQTGQFTAQAAAANAPLSSDESVAVTIYVTEGFAAAIVAFLESNSASPRNVGTDYVEAYVPVSLLPDTSEQEGVISIRSIIPPQSAQSAAGSEGATAHGATAWHSAGLKGQGVRIGIIDVGFSGLRGLMGSELPSAVEARCYTDIGIFTANLTDCETGDDPHGTAVTEAAFDIAPEATYYIANLFSKGDLANVTAWMIDHDVDIINHSVGWIWSGPGDGTSPYSDSPLWTVDSAVGAGITWVNAAGNSATETWFGNFSDQTAMASTTSPKTMAATHLKLRRETSISGLSCVGTMSGRARPRTWTWNSTEFSLLLERLPHTCNTGWRHYYSGRGIKRHPLRRGILRSLFSRYILPCSRKLL